MDSVIDRRGKARKGKTDMPEYIKKTFLHYYLVDGGEGHAYSIAKCMEYTEKWAEQNAVNALPLPSYSSFYRIAMDMPEAVRILMREGERAYYNKASVYTRRDYESIASNDWWVGDTYTCDTLTLGPNGKPHRPYLDSMGGCAQRHFRRLVYQFRGQQQPELHLCAAARVPGVWDAESQRICG